MGRPPKHDAAMSSAERARIWRERRAAEMARLQRLDARVSAARPALRQAKADLAKGHVEAAADALQDILDGLLEDTEQSD